MHKSTLVHVRSKDCVQLTSGFTTDLQINLNTAIGSSGNVDIHLSFVNAEIPHTWYNVSEQLQNNLLSIDGVSTAITEANYDIFTLLDAINTANLQFTASFSDLTSRVSLENTDTSNHTLDASGLARVLGFPTTTTITAGQTVTGPGVVNLATIHAIYLHSDLAVANVISTKNNNFESIIGKVPVGTEPGDSIVYDPDVPWVSRLDARSIASFRLSLRDQNGKLIQLNGCNFELSLTFEIHNIERPETPSLPQPDNSALSQQPLRRMIQQAPQRQALTSRPTPPRPIAPIDPTPPRPIAPIDPTPPRPIDPIVPTPPRPTAPTDPLPPSDDDLDLDSAIMAAKILDLQ
jgi:hypothetical protein